MWRCLAVVVCDDIDGGAVAIEMQQHNQVHAYEYLHGIVRFVTLRDGVITPFYFLFRVSFQLA